MIKLIIKLFLKCFIVVFKYIYDKCFCFNPQIERKKKFKINPSTFLIKCKDCQILNKYLMCLACIEKYKAKHKLYLENKKLENKKSNLTV